MYKLVAIDLDGTMLNQYGVVTENTKNAIKKAIEKGTEIVIASGRPIDSIKTIAKEIGSEKYFYTDAVFCAGRAGASGASDGDFVRSGCAADDSM